jgi:Fe-S-cluster containining protein
MKFKCQQCGACCSKLRGKLSQEELDFLKKHGYGSMPLIQLMDFEKVSFPLWDWESKRFKEWEKEVNVDAKIQPSRAIYDLESNRTIIVTYSMDVDSCPFLKDGKCIIYHRHRAFICRVFPFNKGPFLRTDDEFKKEKMFGECPAMEELIPLIPDNKEDMVKFLDKAFPGGSFLNIVQYDIVTEWVNKTIIDLMRKKLIRPAVNYPPKFLKKRAENSEKIDFTDFLVESGHMSREEIDKLINGFDDNIDAKKKLEE